LTVNIGSSVVGKRSKEGMGKMLSLSPTPPSSLPPPRKPLLRREVLWTAEQAVHY